MSRLCTFKSLAIAGVTAVLAAFAVMPVDAQPKGNALVSTQSAKPKSGVAVGDVLKAGQYHRITNPGRYGLGPVPKGYFYAVVDNKLVRVDEKRGQIMSIIRSVNVLD